eukprot:CAMPEP_0204827842 /NCGR_PEP_ID=MMETSP1346-20131115/5336_1 /ASSEMBLY_ACC=CAM_ASM_000771 /TAXON_ID=215587 /ORGANISM="Aplanochytrium stocchinoi, Strain GSBS06" /LENGTH=323 /DNA_ID=CAMNT_0051956463 /DNA_START=568 /DNA_END=1536 /DNA_ORIENTATION=-
MGGSHSLVGIKSKNLDKKLEKSKKGEVGVVKLLLLGAGESGKTTVFKQMRYLKGRGFDEDYMVEMKFQLIGNVLEGVANLVTGAKDNGIELRDIDLEPVERAIELRQKEKLGSQGAKKKMTCIEGDSRKSVLEYWADPGFKGALDICQKIGKYNIPDTFSRMMDKLAKDSNWGTQNWTPSIDDVLLVRVRTTGMADEMFSIGKVKFRLIDVGGQRAERRKWIHLFNSVTSVIFVTSLSEYDQTLWEDSTTNRLQESVSLFKEHAESYQFKDSAFMLFLNKVDLFEMKYKEKRIPINDPELNNFPDAPTIDQETDDDCSLARNW